MPSTRGPPLPRRSVILSGATGGNRTHMKWLQTTHNSHYMKAPYFILFENFLYQHMKFYFHIYHIYFPTLLFSLKVLRK